MASPAVRGACPLRGRESHLSSWPGTESDRNQSRGRASCDGTTGQGVGRRGNWPGLAQDSEACAGEARSTAARTVRGTGSDSPAGARGDSARDAAGADRPHVPQRTCLLPGLPWALPGGGQGQEKGQRHSGQARRGRWGFWGEGHSDATSRATALAGRRICGASPPGSLPAFREITDERGPLACLSCGPLPPYAPPPPPPGVESLQGGQRHFLS